MASQDDLTLLKEMYQRGEISDEQYDVLRRHVLWGTPLPQLMDDVPAPRSAPPGPSARSAPPAAAGPAPSRSAPPAPDRRSAPALPSVRPAPEPPAPRPAPSPPAAAPVGRGRHASSSFEPDDPLTAPWRPDTGFVPAAAPLPPAPPTGPPPGYRSTGEPPRSHRPPEPSPSHRPPGAPEAHRRFEDPPEAHRGPVDPSEAYRPVEGYRGGDQVEAYRPPEPYRGPGSQRPAGEPAREHRAPGGYQQPPAGYRAGDEPPAYVPSGQPGYDRARPVDEPSAYHRLGEPAEAYRGDGQTPGLGPGARPPEPVSRRRRREAAEVPDDDEPDVDPVAGRVGGRRGRVTEDEVPAVPDRPKPPARRSRGLFAVLTSLLLALALVAAGVWWFALRETGVDAATYARSICGSVRDWQRQVDASSSALVKAIPREEDRTKVRATVQRYYTDLATRTDGLRTAIGAAGPVDVPGGRAYADSLTAAVGDQSGTMRDLAGRAGRLDAAAATVFQISLQALLTGAETAVSEITAALARPAAGTPAALRAALSDEPACAPYVG